MPFTEDYKSAPGMAANHRLAEYRFAAETGPAHRRRFEVEVVVDGQSLGRAEGRSKKEAAQAAAKMALETLNCEL